MQQHIDVLVHFGAGRCSELDKYLALQPGRLLLVEADPLLAEMLHARAAAFPHVQVCCAAVAGVAGPGRFYRYNLPDAGSLHAASGLRQLFPGLRTLEQFDVEMVRPESLLHPLRLAAEQDNFLVIDLPGEELPVLQALQDSRQLHLFRQLYLNCGREPLYEGSVAARQILNWLQEQGFDLLAVNDRQDPDRPCWSLQRNGSRLEVISLRTQLERLTLERDEQMQLANERQGQLDDAMVRQADLEQQLAGLQVQIATLEQTRIDLEQLAGERAAQIEQLAQAHDAQTQLASERQQLLDAAMIRQADLEQQHAGLQAQVATLEQTRIDLEQLAGERAAQIEQLAQAHDAQTQLASERQQLLDAAMIRQADLEQQHAGLQAQVATLEQTRIDLEQLAGERAAQIEQLAQAHDAQTQLASERQQLLDAAMIRQADLEQQLAGLQAQVAMLAQTRIDLEQLAGERAAQVEQLARDCTGFKQELVDARRTTTLSVKLQTLREADLKDLQHRYQELVTRQESQHQLLIVLSDRLSAASGYLHQLADTPELEQLLARQLEPVSGNVSRQARHDMNKTGTVE
ncbi:MAG: hypothetical protein FIB02_10670 [Desulfuromonas sp.]|nr:hypothetical protein [Desulfuromonas sp.]